MQKFKDDIIENQVIESASTLIDLIDADIDTMQANIFTCYKLGKMLFDNNLMPLTNAIKRDIFSAAFSAIFSAWKNPGTFESYLLVFHKIFGDDATIDFTVPGPGKLTIAITAEPNAIFYFIARTVMGSTWVYDYIVDHDGNNIVFNNFVGIDSQYELEKVLNSMVPNGVYTTISLSSLA